MSRIFDVDLLCAQSDFENILHEQIDYFLNITGGGTFTFSSNNYKTASGKNIIVYTVSGIASQSGDHLDEAKIIADTGTNSKGILHFTPMNLSSFRSGFYDFTVVCNGTLTRDDIQAQCSDVIMAALMDACIKYSGTIVGEDVYCSNQFTDKGIEEAGNYTFPYVKTVFITNGNIRANKSLYAAMIDTSGNIYSTVGKTTKDKLNVQMNQSVFDDEDDNDTFEIKTFIFDWLDEPDQSKLKEAISSLTTQEQKMDLIGKYLIKARENDMISASEYMDLFRQAGTFGFSDETLLTIHKLIS